MIVGLSWVQVEEVSQEFLNFPILFLPPSCSRMLTLTILRRLSLEDNSMSDPEFDNRCIAVALKYSKDFDRVVNLKNKALEQCSKSKPPSEGQKGGRFPAKPA